MSFLILTDKLLGDYISRVKESPLEKMGRINLAGITVDYFQLNEYYANIRKAGLEYDDLDYTQCLDFLLMTVEGLDNQG